MSHVFFSNELEGVATWWSIKRRDGVALGFTSHDRDLVFGLMTYRAAPGMVPSAIRRTADLRRDAVEVQGVLAHDAISAEDLETGRYTGARIAIGLVDWETLDRAVLFNGELGDVSREDGSFEAELRSAKAALELDPVPRTSPTCRAAFCDAACGLSPNLHTTLVGVKALDLEANSVAFDAGPPAAHALHGQVKWVDGPLTGTTMQVIAADGGSLVLDRPLSADIAPGARAYLREGCDHTIATCAGRFANAANFRGEPHLPGNDLLARYPTGSR
ncbi:DUF2163 domain-containing protein [Aurantiacibacter luteus]|uniref:Bacteriophage phiJL001 Gp84 C-terminal domain-containing protein n=1 Tax=Aurantiacibacter luteus TaxID=1581420 RepID=A0A0G9MYV1_9SPHN|nr:DUF2163 domain-containing protein [Aurantiacibacter luteus]KLE34458.1 hypothetical protein AAW00_09560 [Aurantiacibacter luteus]